MSHVEDVKVPNCYDMRNPVGCDLAILKLDVGFKLDGCKIRPMSLPSSSISLESFAMPYDPNKLQGK